MSQPSKTTPTRSSYPTVEEEDLDVPFYHHLNIPEVDLQTSNKLFSKFFDVAYKGNPAKKFRPDQDDSTYHLHKDGYKINKNKAARRFELTQASLFISLEVLYREMGKLQSQMAEIHKCITELSQSIPTTFQSSFEGVTKKLDLLDTKAFPPLQSTIEETVSTAVKTAVKETFKTDSNDRLRRNQVFLRNLKSEKSDPDTLKELSDKIAGPIPLKFFRLNGKEPSGIRPLILTFTSAEEAIDFMRRLSRKKRDTNFPYPSLVARPNYSPEEEKIFKEAWAKACSLNDGSGRKEYVVRNLKVVKLDRPGEWTKKERPTRT